MHDLSKYALLLKKSVIFTTKVKHELPSICNKLTTGHGRFIYSIKIKIKFESLDCFSAEEPRAVHMFVLKVLAFRDFVAMSRN